MNLNTQLSETEIIQRILTGEKELFEIIVRRFNPYLYKIGRSYNYNHDDTLDLMQETFINAYLNLKQFQSRSSFKSWLIKIMLNNCFHKKEKLSFKNEIMKDISEQENPLFTTDNSNSENKYINKELGSVIENALSAMPYNYRIIFALREINGLNIAETAEVLNITTTNVKVRLNRAKLLLKNQVEKVYSNVELYEFNLIYCNRVVDMVMNKINDLKIV
jgi:RNA polymerase sigma factor (sigma-70 family)